MNRDLPDAPSAPPALAERLETLAAWIAELDTRVRAAELASGDEKTARELRKAVEAIAKHDPKFHDKIRNHVDVLTDRVATLAGTVATATAAIAGKDGEIAALRRELADANARVETLTASGRPGTPSGELDDIRRALKELAAEREARVPDKRIAKLEEKLELLTQRLDTVSATVSTATGSIAGRDGEVAALQHQLDEDSSRFGAAIAELRQATDPAAMLELRSAIDTLARQSTALQQEMRSKLVALGVDVEGFGARVGELGAALAARDAELARLREHDEREGQRLAAVSETLGQASGALERLDARIAEHGTTLESLTSAQSHERAEVSALADRFTSGSTKVEGLVRELQSALDAMPTGPDPRLTEQIEGVAERLHALTAEVGVLTAADDAIRAAAAVDADALRTLVDDLQVQLAAHDQKLDALEAVPAGPDAEVLERLDANDGRLAEVAAEVRAVAAAADASRDETTRELTAVRSDLAAAAASVHAGRNAADEAERLAVLVAELRARVEATERGTDALASRLETGNARVEALVDDLRESLDRVARGPAPELVEKLDAYDRQLATVAADVSSVAAAADERLARTSRELEALRAELGAAAAAADGVERLGGVVEELRARVASNEQGADEIAARLERRNAKVEALIGDLRGALDTMPQGPDRDLVERLEDQAESIATLTSEVGRLATAVDSSSAASAAESERLDERLGELAARVATGERELTTISSRDLVGHLDALAGRIDTMERKEAERANSLEPLAGEGRLRVEVRALELRVEHAEAAARESRDAVLGQIERLASRIESRLHRLESEPEPYAAPEVADGQVIAIRGGDT